MTKPRKFDPVAILLLVLVAGGVAFYLYGRVLHEETPGDYHVKKANYRLEDGQFDQAIEEFRLALEQNPEHPMAHFGLALAYMQSDKEDEALKEFGWVIEHKPDMAVAYANRGILLDRMGQYRKALADYKKSLELDPKASKGPGVLWRFLHNVADKPPTIADRAAYLEEQLALPPDKRVLRVPELDKEQRMYKEKG
jgi:tetratricopeptide (TPR) repeat protein